MESKPEGYRIPTSYFPIGDRLSALRFSVRRQMQFSLVFVVPKLALSDEIS